MKLLIITERESGLQKLLAAEADTTVKTFAEAEKSSLDGYDSIAVLGGTEENGVILSAEMRIALEKFADENKRLFLEYVDSFRCVYSAPKTQISHHRLAAVTENIPGIAKYELLDSHYNSYIKPYYMMPGAETLLEYFDYVPAHDKAKQEQVSENGGIAFWRDGSLLQCAFRMCDFALARLAPKKRWLSLADYICVFLTGKKAGTSPEYLVSVGSESREKCISRSLGWLSEFLVSSGKKGIKEGLSHNILPTGEQLPANNIRTDCSGEAAGAFLFSGKPEYVGYAKNLFSFCFDKMMIRGGDFDGMLRWTEQAWEVCYQDDAARAMLPALLAAHFGITREYLPDCERALSFLERSTAKDGLRRARTDNLDFIRENKSISSLADEEKGYASAHYNSWYSAALLLCALETGNKSFRETGIKGLETLMALYPDTVREHSETSELCRLIFPLALLCETTGEKRHFEMLSRVADDLMKYRHKSGGYAEWDTGYKAVCSKAVGSECSLLADNGDPVCDLLYSINWLPLGFSYAGYVTGDIRYSELFDGIADFFASAQTVSDDRRLDGSWGRGFDMEKRENYGIPHDVGWGPCAVESGWTVAEITMGLEIGEKIIKKRRQE